MLGKDHLLQLQDIQEVLNLFNEDDNGILKITCYFEEYLGVASVWTDIQMLDCGSGRGKLDCVFAVILAGMKLLDN